MTDTTSNDAPPEAELGDAGRKALQEERAARKAAETRAADLERELGELKTANLRDSIAAAKGLSADQAKHLRGESEEELNAHADELLSAFKPADEEAAAEMPRRRPQERLRSGAVPGAKPERSMGDVAADVLGS
jgi:hypothetical protein